MFRRFQSAGLVLVHAHTRWIAAAAADPQSDLLLTAKSVSQDLSPVIPLWQFYLKKWVGNCSAISATVTTDKLNVFTIVQGTL